MTNDIGEAAKLLFPLSVGALLLAAACQSLPALVDDSDTPSGEGEGETSSETQSVDTENGSGSSSEMQTETTETVSDFPTEVEPAQLVFLDPSPSASVLVDSDMVEGFFHDVLVEAEQPVKDSEICLEVDERQRRCVTATLAAGKWRALFARVFFAPGEVHLRAQATTFSEQPVQASLTVNAAHTATTPVLDEQNRATFYWMLGVGASWVKIAGTFTDPAWDLDAALAMTELYPALWVRVSEPIPSGEHQYKVASNLQGDWEQDTLNPNRVADGKGGYNSVFSVPCLDAHVDSSTDLWWTKRALSGARVWASAVSACDNLSLCGKNDWRLPTISELRTLIRGCDTTELPDDVCGVTDECASIGACWDVDCYGCLPANAPADGCLPANAPAGGCYWPMELGTTCEAHWSSTLDTSDTDYAWTVDFAAAKIAGFDKTTTAFTARCVR